ncbi:MAG: MHS family MFS transporter [Alphaproteobacteria bacterium]|nr:MHS family MFS transporter [Alphaproteobacteria bacterium]
MTTARIAASGLSETEHRAQLRRAMLASTIGTTIEWYDFLLYGQVTALVFGKLFFPSSDPIVGVLQAFAVFFVGFVGRPIGAAIFGHWGDRIGRKATLIATLLVTGLATVAVGLVPTYESIGIWGAVLLTVIRLVQGIGVGGEWGGSVLLAMEWAQTNKNRGFIASWPQFGGPAGFFLANLAVLVFSWLAGDQFLTWGWRIPFLISIVMVGVGLWIRLGISETPVFQKVLDEKRTERIPVLEVLKRQPKQVALTALLRMPEQAPGYIFGAFIFTYGTTILGASRNFLLIAVLASAVVGGFWVVFSGHLSDRVGRKNMYLIGAVAVGVFGFIYFAMLDTRVPALIFLAIVLSALPGTTCYGPQAALIAESFSPRLRYSGSSLGYQLASIIAGGPSPFIATALFAAFASSFPIALYILGCAIVGIVATSLLTDYTNKEISEEYDTVRQVRGVAD